MMCTHAFARDVKTPACDVDLKFLRSVGTLPDVTTMMDNREIDGAQGRADSFSLATRYFRHAKDRHDYASALRLFKIAAMNGDVEASFILGFMFAEGYGARPDFCESQYWYCTAGARGIEEAKYALRGKCERFGLGAVAR